MAAPPMQITPYSQTLFQKTMLGHKMNIMSYTIRTGLKCVGNNLCKSAQHKTQDTSLKFCPNLSIFKEVFPVMKFVVAVGLFTYTSSFILVNVNCQPYRLSRGVKKAFRNRIDYRT